MKQIGKRARFRGAIGVLALAIAGLGNVQAKEVTDADILKDDTITNQVVTYGLGTKGQRFSPLTQVNTTTVKDLVPVWSFRSAVKSSAASSRSPSSMTARCSSRRRTAACSRST